MLASLFGPRPQSQLSVLQGLTNLHPVLEVTRDSDECRAEKGPWVFGSYTSERKEWASVPSDLGRPGHQVPISWGKGSSQRAIYHREEPVWRALPSTEQAAASEASCRPCHSVCLSFSVAERAQGLLKSWLAACNPCFDLCPLVVQPLRRDAAPQAIYPTAPSLCPLCKMETVTLASDVSERNNTKQQGQSFCGPLKASPHPAGSSLLPYHTTKLLWPTDPSENVLEASNFRKHRSQVRTGTLTYELQVRRVC